MTSKKDIYEKIISEEIKAQNLYRALSKALNHAPSTAVFQNLIRIEENHEEKISLLYKAEFPEAVLNLDRDSLPKLAAGDQMESPVEALHFAISREKAAAALYLDLAEQNTNPEIKKIFRTFAAEEELHKKLLEDEILRLGGLVTWFDISELNGLMED